MKPMKTSVNKPIFVDSTTTFWMVHSLISLCLRLQSGHKDTGFTWFHPVLLGFSSHLVSGLQCIYGPTFSTCFGNKTNSTCRRQVEVTFAMTNWIGSDCDLFNWFTRNSENRWNTRRATRDNCFMVLGFAECCRKFNTDVRFWDLCRMFWPEKVRQRGLKLILGRYDLTGFKLRMGKKLYIYRSMVYTYIYIDIYNPCTPI